ncbi:hypothetical protein LTR95_009223 [Oleoguttula sp. CCFEE 5521]
MIPTPFGWHMVSAGTSGMIDREHGSDQVVKRQYDMNNSDSVADLQREYNIYSVLPQHERLLHLLPGSTPERLIFPYLSGGTLREHLEAKASLTTERRLQLAADAAEALSVLHAHGVVHCDISLSNYLLDDKVRLYLTDFAGSKLQDHEGSAAESARYFLPRPIDAPATRPTDVFALGSVGYAIVTGRPPYADKADEEVEELYVKSMFPKVDEILFGDIIQWCWTGDQDSAKDVHYAIEALGQVTSSEAVC